MCVLGDVDATVGPCIWLTNGLFPHFASVLFFLCRPRNEGIMVNTGFIKTLLVACALAAALAPADVQGLDEIKCLDRGDLYVSFSSSGGCSAVAAEFNRLPGGKSVECVSSLPFGPTSQKVLEQSYPWLNMSSRLQC